MRDINKHADVYTSAKNVKHTSCNSISTSDEIPFHGRILTANNVSWLVGAWSLPFATMHYISLQLILPAELQKKGEERTEGTNTLKIM